MKAESGSNRVNRGGSWNNNARNCRSSYRDNNTPDNRNNNLGHRLVLSELRSLKKSGHSIGKCRKQALVQNAKGIQISCLLTDCGWFGSNGISKNRPLYHLIL